MAHRGSPRKRVPVTKRYMSDRKYRTASNSAILVLAGLAILAYLILFSHS